MDRVAGRGADATHKASAAKSWGSLYRWGSHRQTKV